MDVGSGQTYSINRLVELLNNPAGAVYIPRRPDEPLSIYAYISLIT